MPIMPPSIIVNSSTRTLSVSAIALTRCVSNESRKAVQTDVRLQPFKIEAPHQMPMNNAGIAERKIRAIAMATTGGSTVHQPGDCISASATCSAI